MNFTARIVGSVMVCVHNATAPSDAEMEVFFALWREHRSEITGQIVFSAGGAPNAKQRATSLELVNGRPGGAPPTAVLTDSALVRGAVTAFSWVVSERIRAFKPEALLEACTFVAATDAQSVLGALEAGLREVGLSAHLRKAV